MIPIVTYQIWVILDSAHTLQVKGVVLNIARSRPQIRNVVVIQHLRLVVETTCEHGTHVQYTQVVRHCDVEAKGGVPFLPCEGGPVGVRASFPGDLHSIGGATTSRKSHFVKRGTYFLQLGRVCRMLDHKGARWTRTWSQNFFAKFVKLILESTRPLRL